MITLVTGSTGFIGKNFLSRYKGKLDDLILVKNTSTLPKFINNFYNLEDLKSKLSNLDDKIKIYHFATLYSMDESDSEKITESNIEFGKKLFKIIPKNNIEKIIYTNSLFCFDNDKKNSSYVKSKMEFSKFLIDNIDNQKIFEVFLSNTYGHNDIRNKAIPNIFYAVNNGLSNPIKSKSTYIDFSYVGDVVDYLSKEKYEKNIFKLVSNYEYSLDSIYLYLNKYRTNTLNIFEDSVDKRLIKFRDELPITPSGYDESSFEAKLIECYEKYIKTNWDLK